MQHAVALGSISPYRLTHLSDARLVRGLTALAEQDRANTALLLAHIAEIDARHLYVPAGYASMFAYCVEKLHLSEDVAYRRIRAARAARQFPALFEAIAEGRLHLAAVSLIAPFLTVDNADRLIQAATHRRKAEVEEFVAIEFPSRAPETRTTVRPVASIPRAEVPDQLPLGQSEEGPGPAPPPPERADQLVPGRVHNNMKKEAEAPAVSGPAPSGLYRIQVTISGKTLHKLQRATALLSHSVPSGDAAEVMDRALDALIAQLEDRKCGATRSRQRKLPPAGSRRTRHIPAQIRRAVWQRDGGHCTFVGKDGHRCSETRFLEFDHVEPFARGGATTVEGLRLRCRAHNQHEAERVFGAEFMDQKRKRRREAR